MVTSSAPIATRAASVPAYPAPQPPAAERIGLLVRLELPRIEARTNDQELPDVDADDQQPDPDHPRSDRLDSSAMGIDPERIAHAVQELLQAIAPTLDAQVRIEFAAGPATERVAPVLAAVGSDDLTLDLGGRSLAVDGRHIMLTRREFDLLAYLRQRQGVALSRGELMNSVWQTGYLDGDRTIDVHVRRLRMKLGRHAHRLSTLRGFGYRFD